MNKYQKLYSSCAGFDAKTGLRGKRVKLTKPSLRELLYWVNLALDSCVCQLILPSGMSFLYTDASTRLWGAVLVRNGVTLERSGFFPPHLQDAHIGVKELYAIWAGIDVFSSSLAST